MKPFWVVKKIKANRKITLLKFVFLKKSYGITCIKFLYVLFYSS